MLLPLKVQVRDCSEEYNVNFIIFIPFLKLFDAAFCLVLIIMNSDF